MGEQKNPVKVGDKIEILVDCPQRADVRAGQMCRVVALPAYSSCEYGFDYETAYGDSWVATYDCENITWKRCEPTPVSTDRKVHFMLDIEATGIDPDKEDLLQIGVLAVTFKDGFWQPGATLRIDQGTTRKPESEFAKKHMVEIYQTCNRLEYLPADQIRSQMLRFFKVHGCTGAADTFLMGWNASNFDVPFLVNKGILVPNRYEMGPDGKDIMVGDFHYQIYEMGGSLSLAMDALGRTDRKALTEEAFEAYPEIIMPAGKQHDAVYDCYRQTRILNGLIRLVRKGV